MSLSISPPITDTESRRHCCEIWSVSLDSWECRSTSETSFPEPLARRLEACTGKPRFALGAPVRRVSEPRLSCTCLKSSGQGFRKGRLGCAPTFPRVQRDGPDLAAVPAAFCIRYRDRDRQADRRGPM